MACIFGASPAHPKEVYTIELPSPTDWLPPSSERAYRKASLALFRGLTSSEELFKVLSANIMSTGFFIAMKKPSTARRDGLVHRPGFKYPPLGMLLSLTSLTRIYSIPHMIIGQNILP